MLFSEYLERKFPEAPKRYRKDIMLGKDFVVTESEVYNYLLRVWNYELEYHGSREWLIFNSALARSSGEFLGILTSQEKEDVLELRYTIGDKLYAAEWFWELPNSKPLFFRDMINELCSIAIIYEIQEGN